MWREALWRRFDEDAGGNAAMIFGLSVSVLFGAAGAAVDYSRAHAVKSAAQGNLDAALLASARKKDVSDSDVQALLEAYFDKPVALKHGAGISGLVGKLEDSSTLQAEATLSVPTTLLKLLGIGQIDMKIGSRVGKGLGVGSIEVALVLDTTKSMEGSRLASVKTAAKDLVDTVFDLPDATDRVKFSLVPFAQYVNVGLANRNASWMDVPSNSSVTTTN
jgi:Flp pilus assembly protein TadG